MASILSIDYGLKRIGIAISDPDRRFAFPYNVIENKNLKYVLSCITRIIKEREIDLIIVGMPYNLSNQHSALSTKKGKSMQEIVSGFVKKLRKSTSVKVEIFDERLTSFLANENLKEQGISSKQSKKLVDMEASRLILEEYLNTSKL